MGKPETIAQAPSASDALKAALPGFAAQLEKWMPRATTAQSWAHRGHEFEPELQIHGHCDPRFDARCVKATQMVMRNTAPTPLPPTSPISSPSTALKCSF